MASFLTLQGGSASETPAPHIVLVGLPGAGKTTIGEALAQKLDRPYLDFDAEIERREGMSIGELWERHGEPFFRQQERALTEEVANVQGGFVLTPGGGWAVVPGAMALLRPPAFVVWLKVRPEEAIRRMGASRAQRPLLNRVNATGELHRLLVEREPVYNSADVSINTEMYSLARIVERIELLASEAARSA